jgi:hypothetical protein
VLNQPLMDTSEELPATLHAWEPYHGESPAAICSANMFNPTSATRGQESQ